MMMLKKESEIALWYKVCISSSFWRFGEQNPNNTSMPLAKPPWLYQAIVYSIMEKHVQKGAHGIRERELSLLFCNNLLKKKKLTRFCKKFLPWTLLQWPSYLLLNHIFYSSHHLMSTRGKPSFLRHKSFLGELTKSTHKPQLWSIRQVLYILFSTGFSCHCLETKHLNPLLSRISQQLEIFKQPWMIHHSTGCPERTTDLPIPTVSMK